MPARVCHHCKELVEEGAAHDCWTTTEAALTRDLPEDVRDAWERLRETAADFGEQRIYASHHCIMFARKTAYFFVRPKRSALEVCIFLGRTIRAPQIRRTDRASRTKVVHVLRIEHRDEVEAPITDWLREAYETSDALSGLRATTPARKAQTTTTKTRKTSTKKTKKKMKAPRKKAAKKAVAKSRSASGR